MAAALYCSVAVLSHQLLEFTEKHRRDCLAEVSCFLHTCAEQPGVHAAGAHLQNGRTAGSDSATYSTEIMSVLHPHFVLLSTVSGMPIYPPERADLRAGIWLVRSSAFGA
jgi:hypothetical protein